MPIAPNTATPTTAEKTEPFKKTLPSAAAAHQRATTQFKL
jgi:hypothetical protein